MFCAAQRPDCCATDPSCGSVGAPATRGDVRHVADRPDPGVPLDPEVRADVDPPPAARWPGRRTARWRRPDSPPAQMTVRVGRRVPSSRSTRVHVDLLDARAQPEVDAGLRPGACGRTPARASRTGRAPRARGRPGARGRRRASGPGSGAPRRARRGRRRPRRRWVRRRRRRRRATRCHRTRASATRARWCRRRRSASATEYSGNACSCGARDAEEVRARARGEHEVVGRQRPAVVEDERAVRERGRRDALRRPRRRSARPRRSCAAGARRPRRAAATWPPGRAAAGTGGSRCGRPASCGRPPRRGSAPRRRPPGRRRGPARPVTATSPRRAPPG